MINKITALIFGLIFITVSAFSQVEERVSTPRDDQQQKLPFRERIVFGTDFGLSIGTFTYIKLAPTIGYRLTSRLTSGLGPIYIYSKYKYYNKSLTIYGGKVYSSFTVYQGTQKENRFGIGDLLLHVENEVVNVDQVDQFGYYMEDRIWIDNVLLGAGLYQPIGGRFGASIFLLWDVTQNYNSIYYRQNPIFKFGLNF